MTLDLTGQRFGRLVAVRLSDRQNRRRRWLCRCDCGNETVVLVASLRNGNTKSCGCYRAEATQRFVTHGDTKSETPRGSAEYRTWASVKYRCDDPTSMYHGARGIKICDRWRHGENGLTGFECFFADMGPKPTPQHTIDRIDNDGNYEPGNCRWASRIEQMRNTRLTRFVMIGGLRMPLQEALEKIGLSKGRFYRRLREGKTEAEALAPPRRRRA